MSTLSAGARFGPFTIEGYVAGGGMGQVYAAVHNVYGQSVALKVLHARFASDPRWQARFSEEGLLGMHLKHPHILSARELVQEGERTALVMDLIGGGQTLLKVMDRDWPTGLPLGEALGVYLRIVSGVEYLHDRELVHGDLKPENVLIDGSLRTPSAWQPKVTDFGTVSLIAEPVEIEGRPAVVASPRYASPEHLLGVDTLSARSDIYALGLVLHYLLSGHHASGARTIAEAAATVSKPLNLVYVVDQPDPLLGILHKACNPDPRLRYPSCRALALAIRDVLDDLGLGLQLDDLKAELATEIVEDRALAQRALHDANSEAETELDLGPPLQPDDLAIADEPDEADEPDAPVALHTAPAPVLHPELEDDEDSMVGTIEGFRALREQHAAALGLEPPPVRAATLDEDSLADEDDGLVVTRSDTEAPAPEPPVPSVADLQDEGPTLDDEADPDGPTLDDEDDEDDEGPTLDDVADATPASTLPDGDLDIAPSPSALLDSTSDDEAPETQDTPWSPSVVLAALRQEPELASALDRMGIVHVEREDEDDLPTVTAGARVVVHPEDDSDAATEVDVPAHTRKMLGLPPATPRLDVSAPNHQDVEDPSSHQPLLEELPDRASQAGRPEGERRGDRPTASTPPSITKRVSTPAPVPSRGTPRSVSRRGATPAPVVREDDQVAIHRGDRGLPDLKGIAMLAGLGVVLGLFSVVLVWLAGLWP